MSTSFERGAHVARLALRARCASFAFVDDRGTPVVSRNDRAAIPSDAAVSGIARALMTALVARRAPLRVENAASTPSEPASALVTAEGLCSYAAVPLRDVAGTVTGALFVVHHVQRFWADEDIEVLHGIAELVRGDVDGPSKILHELRNAMNAVIGFAELLDDSALEEKQRRLVQMLRSACEQLVGSTTSLLAPTANDSKPIVVTPASARVEGRLADVLVVDDNRENRMLIQAFIGDTAYRCELVDSGSVALQRMRERRYDLVLLDLQMPTLDGLSVTRLIRAQEAQRGGARTPIVAVTAHVLPEQVEAVLRAGCDGHLAKPFRREELMRVIQAHVTTATPSTDPAFNDEEREVHPGLVALVPAFLEARRHDVLTLTQALERGDHSTVSDVAHTLKGIGGSYGFRLISECGARIESALRAGDDTAARTAVMELDAYLQRLTARHVH